MFSNSRFCQVLGHQQSICCLLHLSAAALRHNRWTHIVIQALHGDELKRAQIFVLEVLAAITSCIWLGLIPSMDS